MTPTLNIQEPLMMDASSRSRSPDMSIIRERSGTDKAKEMPDIFDKTFDVLSGMIPCLVYMVGTYFTNNEPIVGETEEQVKARISKQNSVKFWSAMMSAVLPLGWYFVKRISGREHKIGNLTRILIGYLISSVTIFSMYIAS